ncbi:MAG: type VII toxin-antitoxin system MntA family adenylyltransferase antitoxin [Thermoproteota archaeon]
MGSSTSTGEFKYRMMITVEKESLLDELGKKLEKVGSILFAYVYGGFVERGFFRDVDVAVWIEDSGEAFRHEVELSSKLEAELKNPIDVHVLNEAPLPLRHIVFTRGRLLFSRDEEARIRIVDETIRQYADLRMLRSLG